MYIYINTYIDIYTRTFIYIYQYIHIYILHMYVYIDTYMYIYTHLYTFIYLHKYISYFGRDLGGCRLGRKIQSEDLRGRPRGFFPYLTCGFILIFLRFYRLGSRVLLVTGDIF